MKRKVSVLIASIVAFTIYSCGSASNYTSKTSNSWGEYELRPSKITKDGEPFYSNRLDDGTRFVVSYDYKVSKDVDFFYYKLMQDFNWYENAKGGWSGKTGDYFGNVRRYKVGHLYVNPSRNVALYFNPKNDGRYSAYKVKLLY